MVKKDVALCSRKVLLMRAIEIIYRFLREKNLYDEFLEFMKKEKGTN